MACGTLRQSLVLPRPLVFLLRMLQLHHPDGVVLLALLRLHGISVCQHDRLLLQRHSVERV